MKWIFASDKLSDALRELARRECTPPYMRNEVYRIARLALIETAFAVNVEQWKRFVIEFIKWEGYDIEDDDQTLKVSHLTRMQLRKMADKLMEGSK